MAEIGEVSIKIGLDDSGLRGQLESVKAAIREIGKLNISSGIKGATNPVKDLKREITNTKNAAGQLNTKIKETTTSTRTLANGMKVVQKNIREVVDTAKQQSQIQKEWTAESKRLSNIDKATAKQRKQQLNEQKQLQKQIANEQKQLQKQIAAEQRQLQKQTASEQKQLQKEWAEESKRLLKIDEAREKINKQNIKAIQQAKKEMAALESWNPTKETNDRLQKQWQSYAKSQGMEDMQHRQNDARMLADFDAGNKKNTLNTLLASSMKILRITTTITAVYAIIKTAVRAWLNTVKAVLNIYKSLVTIIAQSTKEVTKFIYKFSGAEFVVNKLKSAFTSIADKAKEAFSVENIKNFAQECAEASSRLTEFKNVFDTILTQADSDTMTEWASSISDTFGLNANSALKYASSFTSMFNSMGDFDSEQITVMAQNMTQASADLASFMNLSYDSAFSAIQSGLAGQTKALMKYGISVHQATLNQFLMNKGIKASFNTLSQSQKMYVRQAYILEAMKKYQGDFNKTQYTFANQTRLLSENMGTLKAAIGHLIKGALSPLIIMLNTAIKLLTELLAAPLAALKGMLSEKFEIQFDINNGEFNEGLDNVLSEVEEAEAQIKRSLSSFDELHKLSDDSGASSGGIEWTELLEALNSAYKEIVEDAESNKWEGIMHSLWNKLAYCWNQKDFTVLGKNLSETIKKGLNWINEHTDEVFDVLAGIGKSAATFINGLFEDPALFTETAKTLANSVKGMMITAFNFIAELDATKIGQGINAFITELFAVDHEGLTGLDRFANNLSLSVNKIAEALKAAFENIDAADFGRKIGGAINKLFADINWTNFGEGIAALATAITKALSEALTKIDWATVGTKIDEFIKGLFNPDKDGNTFIDYAGDIIISFVNGLIDVANEILNGEGLENMTSELQEFFAKVKDKLDWKGLQDVGVRLLEELNKLIKGALNSIDWLSLTPIITEWLGIVISGVLNFLVMTIAMIGVTLIKLVVDDVLIPLFENISGFLTTLLELILGVPAELLEGLNKSAQDISDAITGWLEENLGIFGTFLGKIVESAIMFGPNLLSAFGTILDGVKNILQGLIDFITGAFTGDLGQVTDGIKQIFEGLIDVIGGMFEGLFGWVDSMFDWIGEKIDDVKSFFGLADGKSPEIVGSGKGAWVNYQIPQHANGAYMRANTPHLAVVGDNRHSGEFVMPEDKMTQLLDERFANFMTNDFINALTSALSNALGSSGNSGGDLNINLQADGLELGRISLTQQQINAARGGR